MRLARHAWAPIALLVALPASVIAQPQPPPTAAPEERFADIRYHDAQVDRVILSSTAETHPRGTFFISDYDVMVVQLGYAPTDSLQLEITGLPPFLKDQPFFSDLSFKLNVAREPVFRAAFIGSLTAAFDPDRDDAIVGGRFGAVGTLCFTRTCDASLSLDLNAFFNDDTNDFLPVYAGLGLSIHVSRLVSVLLEPSYVFVIGDRGIAGINGVVVGAGIRLSGRNFGVDLSLMRGFGDAFDDINDTLVLGLPFLAFTYRTDGDWADAPPPPPARPPSASPRPPPASSPPPRSRKTT